MHTLGDTISMRVVPQYLDVSDVVSLFQVGECFDKCRPIVGNNLAKCTPLARMSSKIQSPMVFVVSAWREQYLGKCAREQRPCTKHLKPPDFGRCMVSMYILANKGAGVATTGGMKTFQVWRS